MTPVGSRLVGTITEPLGVRAAGALGGRRGPMAVTALVQAGRRASLAWTQSREW
jgi:hypothetical protein